MDPHAESELHAKLDAITEALARIEIVLNRLTILSDFADAVRNGGGMPGALAILKGKR